LASPLLLACVEFKPLGDIAADRPDGAAEDTGQAPLGHPDLGAGGSAGPKLEVGGDAPREASPPPDLGPATDAAADAGDAGPPTDAVPPAPDASPPTPDTPGPDGSGGPADAPPGLVAFWSFDEGMGQTVADRSGNGNRGTTRNGPQWVRSEVPGASPGDFALSFDGQNDYLEVAVKALPRIEGSKTVTVWISASAPTLGASAQRTLLLLGDPAANAGLQLGTANGRIAAWQWGDDQGFVSAAAALSPGFHHLAYTFDGATHRLYLDGQPVGIRKLPLRPGPVTTMRLGTYEAPFEMFGGVVDDLRLYDRALSPQEILPLARP